MPTDNYNSHDNILQLMVHWYTNKNGTAAVSARKQINAQNLQTWYNISRKKVIIIVHLPPY